MTAHRKTAAELRSQRWYSATDMRSFGHRQRTQQMGYRRQDFMGKPVIAIINTWSEMSPCHVHLRQRAEVVKRGIWQAGGFPVELPAISVGEVIVKPTTMLYRNFLAMEAEELLRQHPVDGVVLLGGCDKSTPGLLMGAISMNIPAIYCPAGPMLNGRWHDQKIGAGTHSRKYWDELRAGRITDADWVELETAMVRSYGTCNTMGTASTMTSIAEAIGMTLPGASSIPAADSAHIRMAHDCGERIVGMVWEDLKPSDILTDKSFANGLVAQMALGGSTNAAVHVVAIAGRAGVKVDWAQMDKEARRTPVLANLFPSGNNLMEDLYFAGGLRAILSQLKDRLHLDAKTVNGKTLGENIADAKVRDADVIRPLDNPVSQYPALALLKGNIAPDGCVIKVSAADPKLLKHSGPAVVFSSYAEMSKQLDDPALAIDENSVMVLQNSGPVGAPGMPEWGNLPIPKRVLAKGVRDMVRISDARMSGTHFGTCILHVSPEAAVGGPLALLKTGDIIDLDVEQRTLNARVSPEEFAKRRAAWKPPEEKYERSFVALHKKHVGQADKGCDFDFLERGRAVPEPEIW